MLHNIYFPFFLKKKKSNFVRNYDIICCSACKSGYKNAVDLLI